MTARRLALTTTLLLALALPSAALATPDGGYFALGLGGAVVSGDTGVELEPAGLAKLAGVPGQTRYDERVRTNIDGGMAIELRFGYLIAGLIAPEIAIHGHGNFDFDDGAVQASFVLRYHPIEHFIPHDARPFDANVYFGGGYAIAGYHPDEGIALDDDGKGWEGINLSFGAGFDYQVGANVSLGVDLKVVLPQYSTFIYNRDDGFEYEPTETPSTMFFVPSLQLIFHM